MSSQNPQEFREKLQNSALSLRGHNSIKRGLTYQVAMAYASAVFTNTLSSEEKP